MFHVIILRASKAAKQGRILIGYVCLSVCLSVCVCPSLYQ